MRLKYQNLVVICLLFLLGSRIVVAMGLPSVLNFFHFGILILLSSIYGFEGRIGKSNNYSICLIIITTIVLISSLINMVAPMNIILTLLILLEPFILVSNYERWSEKIYVRIENCLVIFSIINCIISYYQYFVMHLEDDDVRGIFLKMGSGGHINGAFSIVMSVYFVYTAFKYKMPNKRIVSIIISILYLFIVIMCDNKQSILGYGIGLLLLLILNVKDLKKFIRTSIWLLCGMLLFYYLSKSILSKAMAWINNIDYMIEGIRLKFSFIEILKNNRNNILQLFFGFGPGMTLSRVARLLPEYKSISFLGVSYSVLTQYFKEIYASSWLMQASSLWMFYFSFASLYGDLGLFGLISVLTLYFVSMKKLCNNQLSKYLLLVVISHGLLFDWLEEPSFTVVYFLVIVLVNHNWVSSRGRILSMF